MGDGGGREGGRVGVEWEEVTEGRMIGRGKEGGMKEGERRREWSESRDGFSFFFHNEVAKFFPHENNKPTD